MLRNTDTARLIGALLHDADGQAVGLVEQVYQNPTTGNPVWVSARKTPAGPRVFVSLVRAIWTQDAPDTVQVVFTASAITGSPFIDTTDQLTSADITTLAAYYQDAFAADHQAELHDDHGFIAEPVIVTRSEEQAVVRTVSVPAERVRFTKVIVTEEQQVTVLVRREELRIARSPIDTTADEDNATQDNISMGGDPEAESAAFDVVLHEERVVITTETVPVERVHVSTTRVVRDTAVNVALQKERVEITETPARP